MISEEYRKLNAELHESNPKYGTSGKTWANQVAKLVEQSESETVLDYGCGKQTLSAALPGLFITGYDPAVPGCETPPEPHDLVVCGDVLEHIEPEYIEVVLNHLQSLTKKMIFLTVAMVPAEKTLSDGRNAHILLKPVEWWLEQILQRFHLVTFQSIDTRHNDGTTTMGGMFYAVGAPK